MILDQDQESVAYLQIDGVIVVLPNFGDELGKLSVCNNLYQYGIPFANTTYHTYPIDSAEFRRDLDFFMRVCRMIKGRLGRRSLRRDRACLGQSEMTEIRWAISRVDRRPALFAEPSSGFLAWLGWVCQDGEPFAPNRHVTGSVSQRGGMI